MAKTKSLIRHFRRVIFRDVERRIDVNSILLAKIYAQLSKSLPVSSLHDVEFKVFSEWGEDGIIQHLINHVPIENRIFVEFGVEDYTESNTRLLLVSNNWKGVVIDGSKAHVNHIKKDEIYHRYDLTAICAFITKENISEIIEGAGISGDIGLLSIDVDGNDYWIWEAIQAVQPRIVICEYNSVFGPRYPITVPYDPWFVRSKAHFSNLYFGASLPALCLLAKKKGYDFVGSNSVGSNAFFVRSDLTHGLNRLSAQDGYVCSRFRESRSIHGSLTHVAGSGRLRLIEDLTVVDLRTNSLVTLRSLNLG